MLLFAWLSRFSVDYWPGFSGISVSETFWSLLIACIVPVWGQRKTGSHQNRGKVSVVTHEHTQTHTHTVIYYLYSIPLCSPAAYWFCKLSRKMFFAFWAPKVRMRGWLSWVWTCCDSAESSSDSGLIWGTTPQIIHYLTWAHTGKKKSLI